jgi:hypothetical protein
MVRCLSNFRTTEIRMSDGDNTEEERVVPAAPQAATPGDDSARSRRRALRAALAAEAGYILSVRAG